MSGYRLKDSGERRKFNTGSQRDMAEGKGRFDLLPWFSLMELAKHYEAGAKKYDPNNWRKGQPLSVYFDSATRHLAKMAMGLNDERHDIAALWNIACFIETKRRIELGQLPAELDDFPYVHMDEKKTEEKSASGWGPLNPCPDLACNVCRPSFGSDRDQDRGPTR